MKMRNLIALITLSFVFSVVQAQTLYVPNGTSGIGTSSNENVGIGTTSPAGMLEVANSNGATLSISTNKTHGYSSTPKYMALDFLGYQNGNKARIRSEDITYDGHRSKLSFFVNNGQSSTALEEYMTILHSGNVGIGTTSPTCPLEVANSNGATLSISTNKTHGYSSTPKYMTLDFLGYQNGNKARIRSEDITYDGHGSKLSFFVNNGQSSTALEEYMTILHTGNVGIGTTSPTCPLEVANSNGATLSISTNKTHGYSSTPKYMTLDFLGYQNGNKARIRSEDITYDGHGSKLSFFVNNGQSSTALEEYMTILHTGNVGIGTTNPQSLLSVNGKITTKEVKVTLEGWADFVFTEEYKLKDLKEVETFINKNNRLPDIPSEAEVVENGIDLGEMNAKLLQKIEELTLYTIQQQKLIEEQGRLLKDLQEKVNENE